MTTQLSAGIHIEPHRGCRTYSRMIFGQFLEHFHRQVYGGVYEPGSPRSDARGFRLDVIEALRDLRVPKGESYNEATSRYDGPDARMRHLSAGVVSPLPSFSS